MRFVFIEDVLVRAAISYFRRNDIWLQYVTVIPVASTRREKKPNSELGHLVSPTVRIVASKRAAAIVTILHYATDFCVFSSWWERELFTSCPSLYRQGFIIGKSLSQFSGDDVKIDDLWITLIIFFCAKSSKCICS